MKNLILILSLLFIGCSTPYISTDYDREFNFSQIKTYNIKSIEGNSTGQIDLNVFSQLLENALQNKGFSKEEQADIADIKVEIISNESISKNNSGSVGVGGGNYGRGFGGGISVGIPISVKKLNKSYIINIYSPANQLVWQGIYEVQKSMKADKQKIAESAVNKLIEKFPPNR